MTLDPIHPAAAHVLDLFHGPLAEVRFPDVDREALDADAAAVRAADRAVRDAEAALGAAKEALDVAQRALQNRAHRALAYARIFAETRPELASAIGMSSATAAGTPDEVAPRRRRARKVASDVGELLPDLAAE